jgi:hypothetical protein
VLLKVSSRESHKRRESASSDQQVCELWLISTACGKNDTAYKDFVNRRWKDRSASFAFTLIRYQYDTKMSTEGDAWSVMYAKGTPTDRTTRIDWEADGFLVIEKPTREETTKIQGEIIKRLREDINREGASEVKLLDEKKGTVQNHSRPATTVNLPRIKYRMQEDAPWKHWVVDWIVQRPISRIPYYPVTVHHVCGWVDGGSGADRDGYGGGDPGGQDPAAGGPAVVGNTREVPLIIID